MRIGNVKLKNGLFLAPMANFSTPPFRKLCKEFGVGLTTSELVACDAVLHKNWKTEALLKRAPSEKPFAIQIFGSEPRKIALAAQMLEKKCEIIDINLGCPMHCVVDQGAGAALLKKPAKIAAIFDALSTIKLPVTAKIRIGFATKTKCAEIAHLIERHGASAISVHGRLATQGYSAKVDLPSIARVKRAVSIPVIGNGDISTPEDAKRMVEKTGCDGVMMGRGALGNPFIFRQINDYFGKGSYHVPSPEERRKVFLRFLKYAKNEKIAFLRMQSFYFTRGLDGASELRRRIAKAKKFQDIEKIAASAFKGKSACPTTH